MKSFLEFLLITIPLQRNAIMKTLTDQQLKILIEIIYNAAMNVIPVPDKDKKLLRKYKRNIREVLADGISKRLRRRRLLTLSNVLPIFLRHYLKWQDS